MATQCYPATKQNTAVSWFVSTDMAHATQAYASGFCQRQRTCLCWSGHTSEPAVLVLSPTSFQYSVKLTLATAALSHHIWLWRGSAEQSWCSRCHNPAKSSACPQEHLILLCCSLPNPTGWAPGHTWLVVREERWCHGTCFSTGRDWFWLHTTGKQKKYLSGWHHNSSRSSPIPGMWPLQGPPAPAPALAPAWCAFPHCSSRGGSQTWPRGCHRPAKDFNCPNR